MSWMIIPHLAVFNVMITLGELARLCNCGLVLHELRNPPPKKNHQFRRHHRCQNYPERAGAAFRVVPDVWIGPQLLQ